MVLEIQRFLLLCMCYVRLPLLFPLSFCYVILVDSFFSSMLLFGPPSISPPPLIFLFTPHFFFVSHLSFVFFSFSLSIQALSLFFSLSLPPPNRAVELREPLMHLHFIRISPHSTHNTKMYSFCNVNNEKCYASISIPASLNNLSTKLLNSSCATRMGA